MGVSKLWKEVLPHVKARPRISLTQLHGMTLGVDISVWLYHGKRMKDVVLGNSSSPQYEPEDLLDEFKR